MAQVLAFPGAHRAQVQQAIESVPEQTAAPDDVRQESHTAEQPVKPAAPKPPVYVRVRADVFQDMLNALSFYAAPGWDDGKKARKVLSDAFAPEQV